MSNFLRSDSITSGNGMTSSDENGNQWKPASSDKQSSRDTKETKRGLFGSLLLSGLSATLDPLFFLTPVVNEKRTCVDWDKNLRILTVLLRTLLDVVQLILLYVLHKIQKDGKKKKKEEKGWKVARRIIISVVAVLPLPQVVVFAGKSNLITVTLLKIVVVIQVIPRIYRIILCYEKASKSTQMLFFYTWFAAVYNLGMYVLGGSALGAFWYLRAVERWMDCWEKAWKEACPIRSQCNHTFIWDCHDNTTIGNDNNIISSVHKYCPLPPSTPPNTTFDYGIYLEAFESKVFEHESHYTHRWMYSFWWGLRNLTSLGQNLEKVNYKWDMVFCISLAISGLVLFALLIGNLQNYLRVGRENRKRKKEDLKRWAPFGWLSKDLRKEITRCESLRWKGTTEVNLDSFWRNLPDNLREKTKSQLCEKLIFRVPKFKGLSTEQLTALHQCAKPVVFPERSYIHQEGDLIIEMVFFLEGNSLSYTERDKKEGKPPIHLPNNTVLGLELIQCCSPSRQGQAATGTCPSGLPIVQRTIKTLTKIEAFVITELDLRNIIG